MATKKEPIFTLTNVLVGGGVVALATGFFLWTNHAQAAQLPAPTPTLVVANQTRATGGPYVGDVLQVTVTPAVPYTLFARRPDGNEVQVTCPPNVACTVTLDAAGAWRLRAQDPSGAPLGMPVDLTVAPRLALVPPPGGIDPVLPGGPGTIGNLPVLIGPPLTGVTQTVLSTSSEGPEVFIAGNPVRVQRVAVGGLAPRYMTTVYNPAGVIALASPWVAESEFRFTPSVAGMWKVVSRATEGSVNVSSTERYFDVLAN